MRAIHVLALVALPVTLATCGGDDGPVDPVTGTRPKSLTLYAPNLELFTPDTFTMIAYVYDDRGAVLSVPVTWSSSAPGVATVDSNGHVTAVAAGKTTISARSGSAEFGLDLAIIAPLGMVRPVVGTQDVDYLITFFPDADTSRTVGRDSWCGPKSFNHDARTVFALTSFAKMDQGIPVVAAADGDVATVHDGEPDRNKVDAQSTNTVKIQHRDGFTTLYQGLRNGSIVVQQGQHVTSGMTIGMAGNSGWVSYPELLFTVERNGEGINPFSGPCASGISQWAAQDSYKSDFRVLSSGMTTILPTIDDMEQPPAPVLTFSLSDQRVTMWLEIADLRNGDMSAWRLRDPSGVVQNTVSRVHTQTYSLSFWYGYFTIPGYITTPGVWSIDYLWNGSVVATRSFTIAGGSNAPPMQTVRASGGSSGASGGGGVSR